MRILALSNPTSGKASPGLIGLMDRTAAAQPRLRHSLVRNPAEVASALGEQQDDPPELLIVNAGDGTVAAACACLLRDRILTPAPVVAILPSGTTNMTAGDVGLRGRRAGALRRALDWASRPRRSAILQRSLLRVDDPGTPGPNYGVFFGAAGILQGISYCRRYVHRLGVRGELGPGLALARLLWGYLRGDRRHLHPEAIQIEFDGAAATQLQVMLLMVTTLQRLLLGLDPFWGSGAGSLRYTAIEQGSRHMGRVLPAMLRGRDHPALQAANGFHSRCTPGLKLWLPGGYTLDGELFAGGPEPIRLSDGGSLGFLRL